jgi:hypothetical protein
MKRRMILILCLALLMSLAVFAVAEAAGGQYARSWSPNVFGPPFPDPLDPGNAVGAPNNLYAKFSTVTPNFLDLGMGKRVCGPLFVYGLAGSAGEVAVFKDAVLVSTSQPVAIGILGTYDATHGRYPVALFVWDAVNLKLTSKPYSGNFQSVVIDNDATVSLYPLSVDAVGATVCQNGQGQNQNGQGQNGQGQWWGQNGQGQNEP